MWLALLAGVACNNVIGMLWYSPLMFMSVLVETTRINPHTAEMTPGMIVGCNVLALMECFGLLYALDMLHIGRSWMDGARIGFLIWQFFIFPSLAVHYFFDRRPVRHLALIAGHHLCNMVIEGAIIAILK